MATGTLRWPVFAELDRRLYSGFDIQALEVMRVMPPGFLWGIGPNSPVLPGEDQEIGLTVAGIADCPGTSEILSVFVEFIQVVTVTEKAWLPPPGEPAMQPTLTDADFAARSRTLPAAGREDLLRLLFLVIKAERAGWAGLSANPATGHWTVSLSRQVRDFANIRDIDDYWSRRYKPWETGRPASAPAASTATVPVPSGDSGPGGNHATARSTVGTTGPVERGAGRGTVRGPEGPREADRLAPRFARASGVQIGSGNVQFNYFYDDSARTGSSGTSLAPELGVAGSLSRGHAFISYVREDSGEVDELQRMLEDAGVPVWHDTASLWPGEDWRAKIRGAISRDALVFIACFSSHSIARRKSYQNEELLLAIDQLRRRSPDDPWLIPVRFDDCDIPDFELGAGRTLTSIQRADLFGPNRDMTARRLVETIQRMLAEPAKAEISGVDKNSAHDADIAPRRSGKIDDERNADPPVTVGQGGDKADFRSSLHRPSITTLPSLTAQPPQAAAESANLPLGEAYERIVVYVGDHPQAPQGFNGIWLIAPDEEETRTDEEGYDTGAYWGVALTQRGKFAVYVAHVNERWPASLHVYNSLDEAEQDDVPVDILAKAAAGRGDERIIWREI
jgi:hypothetical protein